MRINHWDDWYAAEALARELDASLASEERPDSVGLDLWLPSTYVGHVTGELSQLDDDLRRGAVLLPSRMYSPRLFPFAPILSLPSPVNPEDGRLNLRAAREGESIWVDLAAIGVLVGLLVDVPALFFMIRAASRRIPFRLRIEREPRNRAPKESATDDRIPELEAHFSDRQAALIEANRIKRRIVVRHPSGSNIEIEEFE